MSSEQMTRYSLNEKLIGKRIRQARKKKNLTQDELSERCMCTPTHICNIENGKIGISLSLLYNVSIVLDEKMDYFVMDCDGVNPQFKINKNIAPKLNQCDSDMLDIIDCLLDKLISYRSCHIGMFINDNNFSDLELYKNKKAESIWLSVNHN